MFEARGYLFDAADGRMPAPRAFREIVDILARCRYNRLLVRMPPPGGPADEWGDAPETPPPEEMRRMAAYCEMQGISLEAAPVSEASLHAAGWVCADTAVSRSLAGRVEDMRENMEAAEREGRERGATGYLVADWGDECRWQPLAASLPAIILGGAFALSGAKAARMDLELELDRTMGVPLGGTLLRLGTLYLRGGRMGAGFSELFNILSHDHGYSRDPRLTQPVLEDISGVAHGCRLVAERWTDRSDWAKEIVYMANLVDCACNRRDERRLRELRDEHGAIWRLRSREGGRILSLARLPRF